MLHPEGAKGLTLWQPNLCCDWGESGLSAHDAVDFDELRRENLDKDAVSFPLIG